MPGDSRRVYRQAVSSPRFRSFQVAVKETDLWIALPRDRFSETWPARVERLVWRQRRLLERYLAGEPRFAAAMEPFLLGNEDVPAIVLAMVQAGNRAGVGPMAAVAGVFAEIVGSYMLQSSPEVIVENGGDLFLKIVEPVTVGIYAGNSPLSGQAALYVEPERTPLGICTSSGTVGPSVSRGRADAAVALAPSAALADAAATALGNLVQGPADLEQALAHARSIPGVTGALLICGDKLAAWGEVKLCSAQGRGI